MQGAPDGASFSVRRKSAAETPQILTPYAERAIIFRYAAVSPQFRRHAAEGGTE